MQKIHAIPKGWHSLNTIFFTTQEDAVKVCGCYLIIISAALTAQCLTDVASLWTLQIESTDFCFFYNVMIGPNKTFDA